MTLYGLVLAEADRWWALRWMLLLVFVLGLVASVLATLLVRAIAQRRIRLSMGVELLAGILTIVAWQVWALTENEWRVLFAELVGSVLGTGVALRWGL